MASLFKEADNVARVKGELSEILLEHLLNGSIDCMTVGDVLNLVR